MSFDPADIRSLAEKLHDRGNSSHETLGNSRVSFQEAIRTDNRTSIKTSRARDKCFARPKAEGIILKIGRATYRFYEDEEGVFYFPDLLTKKRVYLGNTPEEFIEGVEKLKEDYYGYKRED